MRTWTARRHFDAPIERVFDLTTDPRRMQEMFPSIDEISEVSGGGDAVGDSFRFRDRLLGRKVTGTTVALATHAADHRDDVCRRIPNDLDDALQ